MFVFMPELYDPLTGPAPTEVPLTSAPLVNVIAQVRFPKVLGIEDRDAAARFQSLVKDHYPVLREEKSQGVVFGGGASRSLREETTWRFSDLPQDWRLSLAPGFLALDTSRYQSRTDFLERWFAALSALQSQFGPRLVDRFGIRYVDRIVGDAVAEINRMVRPELSGLIGTPVGAHATHALTEAMFTVGGAELRARWALLPAGATHDPGALQPIPQVSWVLDLDMFTTTAVPFRVQGVMAEAERFAERIYAFFRWAVTDDFLRRYGGSP